MALGAFNRSQRQQAEKGFQAEIKSLQAPINMDRPIEQMTGFGGVQQGSRTLSRRDFKPKIKFYKHR